MRRVHAVESVRHACREEKLLRGALQKIALAEADTTMTQNVISSRHMEIEVRNNKMVYIVYAGKAEARIRKF